jgi:hypothetical protein
MLSLVLLLTGCITAKRKAAPAITPTEKVVVKKGIVGKESIAEPSQVGSPRKKWITGDVQVFKDLQEIDLDGDGVKEIIAIYSKRINENLSGVKVIKIINDNVGDVVFKRTFYTPNIKFQSKNGTSCIIAKEKADFWGLLFNKIYCWNGKSYVAKGE